MPALTQSLVSFGIGIQSLRTKVHLRRRRTAVPAQEKALAALLPRLALTQQGRADGIESGAKPAQFARRVPVRFHADYAPLIERMIRGEPDVLWPGRCVFFAQSAGTATGTPKLVPLTEEMLAHFRQAELDALLYYTARVGHGGIFRGRHLLLNGSTVLTPIEGAKDHEAYRGNLGGIITLNLPKWAERHFLEPGAEISRLPGWDARLAATVARTRTRDVTLLAGIPRWLVGFAEAILADQSNAHTQPPHLQAMWPNLECVIVGGTALPPFTTELRRLCGPEVKFHQVYSAVEGFIAAQDADPQQGLRLLCNAGIYYEFIPMADFDASRPERLAEKAVPLAGVKTGVDYALLMTTPAGFCRYVVGDVVRFTGTEPPRIIYVGRTDLRLNTCGENVHEHDLNETLVRVCQRHRWTIINFHVAPLKPVSTGPARGRHEWWIELRPGTVNTPTGPLFESELDAELRQLNPRYDTLRNQRVLETPLVRLVMPGTFAHWMKFAGVHDAHCKMPRCRGDRIVADEFAQIARFNPE